MSDEPIFRIGQREPGSIRTIALLGLGAALLLLTTWWVYSNCFMDVKKDQIAILFKKTGKDLPNGEEIAPSAEYKGPQRELVAPGFRFVNPYEYSFEVIDQVVITNAETGILVSLTGDDLPYGEILARLDENGNPLTKGIVPGVLRAGRYPINPYLLRVARTEPRIIPAGFKGVVTNLSGPLSDNPNQLLVPEGKRGVQVKALDPGTHYINPYEHEISLIDCRSQRFNLAERKDMGFPSKDGFWVSLDGIVEFRVNPERAAEVYVNYNEDENGDSVDEEIIRKVILPNARSFCRLQGSNELGREFIQGETRTKFQETFQTSMREACEPLGIEIIQALITRIRPPQQIAEPVRLREIAKQKELQFQQQILQQESEQKLAIETEMVNQKKSLVLADQEVVKTVTEAKREQEVAVTEAEQRLAVAQYKLNAAKDEAAAVQARGKADAEVIQFQNAAEAAGWKKSVEAFAGNGAQYADYVLYQKLSSAYREIMVNTADSPIMRVFEQFGATVEKNRPPAAKAAPSPSTTPPATTAGETKAASTAQP